MAGTSLLSVVTSSCRTLARLKKATLRQSAIGRIAESELLRSVEIRAELSLDSYVVMPNHMQAVVVIRPLDSMDQLRNTRESEESLVLLKALLGGQARSLSSFAGGYKSAVTSSARRHMGKSDFVVWNRGLDEHVVRTERALHAIRNCILNNALQWELDRYMEVF